MKKAQFAIQIAVSVGCLVALVVIVHPAELWAVVSGASPAALVGTFLLMPLAMLARALRWRYLLASKAVVVPVASMCRIVFIASALNLFLPAGLGDLASSYYGWRTHGHKEAMLASAMADKLIGLFTLCLLGIGSALAISDWQLARVTIAVTMPLAAVVLFPRILPWHWASAIFHKLYRKDLSADLLRQTSQLRPRTVGGALGISVIGWIFTNLMYYFACRAFTSNVSMAYIFAAAPLINLMRVLPVTVSGLGSADLLMVFLFGLTGVRSADALAASMAINMALLILPGLIGLSFILLERGHRFPQGRPLGTRTCR